MSPPILFDGLRLYLGALVRTPRGVDRIDHAYARFLLDHWPNDCLGVLPTPWGIRLYDRDRARQLLTTVDAAWREQQAAGLDPAFAALRQWLINPAQVPHVIAKKHGSLDRTLRLIRDNGMHWGRSAITTAPRNAIYLNIGQLGWAAPVTTHWLLQRPDIKPIFMMHDVIPLHHPHFVSTPARLSQKWMLGSVLRKARGLITTTRSASDTVTRVLRQIGLPEIPVRALPLPIPGVFLQPDQPDSALQKRPYFITCGAIEPRKNHDLLIRVWHRLLQRLGPAAPRLVIAGTPAHRGTHIVRQIQHSRELRNHVAILSGLASPSLRALMRNAQAMLMPSLAEGFGLPLIESLAVGTPVIASDIEAHREAGDGLARYLDPRDDAAWASAIVDIIENTEQTAALRQRIAAYRPLTAAAYFQSVSEFLAGFA